jgi:hypothetical protein
VSASEAAKPVTAATGEISEQYRRARPSERETADSTWLGLRWLLGGPTNTGRLRGDGNVEERAGSEHQWQQHQASGNIHRRTISSRRLRGELGPLEDDPRPNAKRCNRTTLRQSPLCAICTELSGRVPAPITVSPNEPRSFVVLAPTSTSSSMDAAQLRDGLEAARRDREPKTLLADPSTGINIYPGANQCVWLMLICPPIRQSGPNTTPSPVTAPGPILQRGPISAWASITA